MDDEKIATLAKAVWEYEMASHDAKESSDALQRTTEWERHAQERLRMARGALEAAVGAAQPDTTSAALDVLEGLDRAWPHRRISGPTAV